jgi:hypothetical protein
MKKETAVAEPQPAGGRALRFLQWVTFVALFFVAVIGFLPVIYIGLPGFPTALFWISLASSSGLALAHLPAMFFRFARNAKVTAYVAILPIFILTMMAFGQGLEAHYQTPAGKAEKAKLEAADALAAKDEAERAETRRALADVEKSKADLEAYEQKLDDCFSSWGHRLDSLEDEVKGSLHNPDAFQHVETLAIVTDSVGNNVAMRFRAENGFGALRAATVKAKIDVSDCSVISVGEPIIAQ